MVNRPIALPRSFEGKAEVSIAIAFACIIAAPIPWNSLNKITISSEGADPASTAPNVNTINPVT